MHFNRFTAISKTKQKMEKWKGKIALVTGASAGIGADLTVALANAGCIVVGVARRVEAIEVNFVNFLQYKEDV